MDFFQNLLGKGYAYGTDLFLKNDTFSLYSFYYDRHAYWYVTKEKTSKLGNILKDDVCLLGYEIQLEEASCFVQTDGQIVIPLLPYSIMEYDNDKEGSVENTFHLPEYEHICRFHPQTVVSFII